VTKEHSQIKNRPLSKTGGNESKQYDRSAKAIEIAKSLLLARVLVFSVYPKLREKRHCKIHHPSANI
jgi:hypothetical protein